MSDAFEFLVGTASTAIEFEETRRGARRAGRRSKRAAGEVITQTDEAVLLAQEEAERLVSQQRAAFGASGFESTSGTALVVQVETHGSAEEEQQRLRRRRDVAVREILKAGREEEKSLKKTATIRALERGAELVKR